jgi:hypothetical protein
MAKDATEPNVGTGGVSVFASAAIDAPAEALWHNEEQPDGTNEVKETVSDDQQNQDEVFARLDAEAQKQQAEKFADENNAASVDAAADPAPAPAPKAAAKGKE